MSQDHDLWLCDKGRALARYGVALGRGGTGKRAEGDRKTPLGTYPLGKPRPSNRFGTFIPVGYPTAEQRLQGFTGSDVGIHGPERRLRWAGGASTWFDWTAGCIALGNDENVQSVASWVQVRHPTIVIR
jgi:murein L,D-transpeptidase YafK